MKKANRLRAIENVESELRYIFNNRIRIRDREDYEEDMFASDRLRIRQLINILRALREND
jgi:hypothetical protein